MNRYSATLFTPEIPGCEADIPTPPWGEAEELVTEQSHAAEYPIDALGPLADAVKEAAKNAAAPVELAAQSALAYAALSVQNIANVQTLGSDSPLSLYCLTIASSGERKSASDKWLSSGLRRFEAEQNQYYPIMQRKYKDGLRLYEANKESVFAGTKGNACQTAVQADLDALGEPPQQPQDPYRTISDMTVEGLIDMFKTSHPSMGMFNDEAGAFIGGFGMAKDTRLKTLATLSKLWDGSKIGTIRRGNGRTDGKVELHDRRFTSHLMCQPDVARDLIDDPLARDQGFLARLLIAHPLSLIGKRINVPNPTWAFLHDFDATLFNNLEADTASPNQRRTLRLSQEAKAALVDYYKQTERAQAKGGTYEVIRGTASKSPEMACRMSGVLTLWVDRSALEVNTENMMRGIRLAQFYLDEALRLFSDGRVSDDVQAIEKLRDWLMNRHACNKITVRDVCRTGPLRTRNTKAVKDALSTLQQYNWVRSLNEKGTQWEVRPA